MCVRQRERESKRYKWSRSVIMFFQYVSYYIPVTMA